MGNWHDLNLNGVIPVQIRGLLTSINTVSSVSQRITGTTNRVLNVVTTVAGPAATNPFETALRTAATSLDTAISGLLGNTQAHTILIPVLKKKLVQEDTFLERFAERYDENSDARAFADRAYTATGGTAGFWRALAMSIADPGDYAKPDFPDKYAVTGTVIVAGTEGSIFVLQDAFSAFRTLFRINPRIVPSNNAEPVIRNLRATARALPQTTPASMGIELRWDAFPPIRNLTNFSGERVVIKEIVVIRSTDPTVREATQWTDLFDVSTLPDDRTVLPKSDRAEVVARVRNDGHVLAYVDTHGLSADLTYYYTTALRFESNGEVQPLGALSNVVRANRKRNAATVQSHPPDWYATPTLIQAIPPLEGIVNQARLAANRLGARTVSNSGSAQLLASVTRQAQSYDAQLSANATRVTAQINRLQGLLGRIQGNGRVQFSATTITVKTGGIRAWMEELGRRLSNTSDSTTPNFGDASYVVGVVVLAGAPNVTQLSPFTALLNTLFGGSPNAVAKALADVFNNGASAATAASPTTSPTLGFTASFEPSKTPTC